MYKNFDQLKKVNSDPNAEIDARVQAVLDEYWEGTRDLSAIKRLADKNVYTAMYDGAETIVKSIDYNKDTEEITNHDMLFTNFIGYGDVCPVAKYVTPGVEHSDDFTLLVTMSEFAYGVKAQELGRDAPLTWITDEKVVRTMARWWSDFRRKSIEFKMAYPEVYENAPQWDTFQDGWQTLFTKPTIPITEESFGMVHGDAHCGNWMLEDLGHETYKQTTIDWDNQQKSWYIVDPGTVIWLANMQMWLNKVDERESKLEQMKTWFIDEYGWNLTYDELKQGCQWRKDFMHNLLEFAAEMTPWTDPAKYQMWYYLHLDDTGKVPLC